MLAMDPDLVDLSQQPADKSTPLIAIQTHPDKPVQDSSAEFGEEAIELMVKRVNEQVKHRLENPDEYYGHGWKA
jgi:hypothetical protein